MAHVKLLDVLTEFGANGGAPGVRPLGSLADAVTVLGPPRVSGRIDDQLPWPQWFQFGDLWVEVCHCGVINRASLPTWHEEVCIPAEQTGKFHTVPSGITFTRLSTAFSAVGIAWRRISEHSQHRQFAMETVVAGLPDVTVHFTFTADDGQGDAEALLHGVHATEHTHLCPQAPREDP